MSKTGTVSFQSRFSKDDLDWLKKYAKDNQRSVAQELRHMVQNVRQKKAPVKGPLD